MLTEVTGVVLCGGQSRRMGRDKAALPVGGRTLLERAIETLSGIPADVVLACGPSRRYADLGLPLALDSIRDGGPLAGLEAGLARAETARTEWVAVLACDMPRADADLYRELLSHARAGDADACLLATPQGLEPLCGVYRRTLLGPVRAALAAGERKALAWTRFATAAGRLPRLLTLPARDEAANLNTPEEAAAEIQEREARA